jgi:hypothetical protein
MMEWDDSWLEMSYEDRFIADTDIDEEEPDEDIDWDGGPVDFTEEWM